MPTLGYSTPGAYYERVDAGVQPVSPVRMDVAAFVGIAQCGPLNLAVPIESWRQFVAYFGDVTGAGYLAYAVARLFRERRPPVLDRARRIRWHGGRAGGSDGRWRARMAGPGVEPWRLGQRTHDSASERSSLADGHGAVGVASRVQRGDRSRRLRSRYTRAHRAARRLDASARGLDGGCRDTTPVLGPPGSSAAPPVRRAGRHAESQRRAAPGNDRVHDADPAARSPDCRLRPALADSGEPALRPGGASSDRCRPDGSRDVDDCREPGSRRHPGAAFERRH